MGGPGRGEKGVLDSSLCLESRPCHRRALRGDITCPGVSGPPLCVPCTHPTKGAWGGILCPGETGPRGATRGAAHGLGDQHFLSSCVCRITFKENMGNFQTQHLSVKPRLGLGGCAGCSCSEMLVTC